MSNASDIQLAIVIPAYRKEFLGRALASIARQTDKRFRLYVGDDCSPAELESLVQSGAGGCELVYRRFEENLGARSLVQQWDRCVKLSREPWVWLFSDDDVMEPGCVAAFYQTLEETHAAFELYRFNTFIIDADDRAQAVNSPHPEVESAMDFAYHRLRGERHSTVQELIFSRAAYDRVGGFLDLPCAWCSDDAGIIRLSDRTGMRTIAGPRVQFRQSGMNVSSTFRNAKVNRDKRRAVMGYLDWLLEHFRAAKSERTPLNAEMLRQEAERWFLGQCQNLETCCTIAESRELAAFHARMWGGSRKRHFYRQMKRNSQLLLNRFVKGPLTGRS